MNISPVVVRAIIVVVIVGSGIGIFVSGGSTTAESLSVGDKVANARATELVVATQSGQLVFLSSDGVVRYLDNRHDSYWDIDPLSNGRYLYVAADDVLCGSAKCTHNIVGVLNLTSGERRVLLDRTVPGRNAVEWHDADLGVLPGHEETVLLVARMETNQVEAYRIPNGTIVWGWSPQSELSIDEGGDFVEDWTHMNDIEFVPGGVMVSLRNQDRVVFVNETGLNHKMTLGEQNNHDILNRQHNPDYIPKNRGGPAVLIADSHNQRVVEYQRIDKRWVQTWQWSDPDLVWPRDADRTDFNTTLIADTRGNRLIEVGKEGQIVWLWKVPSEYSLYDVESIPGDESIGWSAQSIGLESRSHNKQTSDNKKSPTLSIWIMVKSALPGRFTSAIFYLKPDWLTHADLPFLALAGISAIGWILWEIYRYRNRAVQ